MRCSSLVFARRILNDSTSRRHHYPLHGFGPLPVSAPQRFLNLPRVSLATVELMSNLSSATKAAYVSPMMELPPSAILDSPCAFSSMANLLGSSAPDTLTAFKASDWMPAVNVGRAHLTDHYQSVAVKTFY